ncbi:MAG: HAD family hydrolase [Eubacteriales bacterium]|nr:HAD family hydrolase [Eubacteriales bacterium]
MLQMIACDIDGTILFDGQKQLDPRLFPLIRRLQACGVEYLSCSGRQYANQRRLFAPIADEISYICENGSLTMHRGEAVACETLDRAKSLDLLNYIQAQPGCEGLLSTQRCCYVKPKEAGYLAHMREYVGNDTEVTPEWEDVPEDFIKISLYCPRGDLLSVQKRMAEFAEPYLTPVLGGYNWIDFLRDGCDKGIALRKYCQLRGIAPEDVIGIGDNENDMALLGTVGEMWAMQSGHPNLIARADRSVHSVVEELDKLVTQLEAK